MFKEEAGAYLKKKFIPEIIEKMWKESSNDILYMCEYCFSIKHPKIIIKKKIIMS